MKRVTIGDITIALIHEMDSPSGAVPAYFDKYEAEAFEAHRHWLVPQHVEEGSLRIKMSFHSWLVETPKYRILIDSCCGNHKDRPGKPRFHQLDNPFLDRLRAAGVAPADIDFVMCTHLHVDHVGWNTQLENGRWVPTFPNARYLMARKEVEFWRAESVRPGAGPSDVNTYNDSVLPVIEHGLADLIEGHERVEELAFMPSPGHTPGHCCIGLGKDGLRAIFTGDVIHSPLQLPMWQWSSSFCEDPPQATRSRKQVLDLCADRGDLLMPSHFMAPHVCRVRRAGSGFMPDFDVADVWGGALP